MGGMDMNMGSPFDIFNNIFGGGGHGNNKNRNVRTKGKSVVKEIDIELKSIYNEAKINLTINRDSKCMECNGLGCKDPNDVIECSKCDGSGMFVRIQQFGPGMISQSSQTCPTCRGTGRVIKPDSICVKCGGSKKIKKKKKIILELNSNNKTGDKVVFDELSDYNPDVDIQGDLVLVLNIVNNVNDMIRIDNNLFVNRNISLIDALCGLKLSIKHLNGNIVHCKTSDVIQPNSIHKIDGEGVNRSGGLYIKFSVQFPTVLSDERKLYIKKLIEPVDDTKVSKNGNVTTNTGSATTNTGSATTNTDNLNTNNYDTTNNSGLQEDNNGKSTILELKTISEHESHYVDSNSNVDYKKSASNTSNNNNYSGDSDNEGVNCATQ